MSNTPLGRLLNKNKLLIFKIIRRYFIDPHDIDDIAQETFARALEAEKKTDIKYPTQFLVGIAKNVAREELKRRSKITQATIEDCDLHNHPSNEPMTDAVLESKEKLRIFFEAISKLPPQCRKVFLLKHSFGASHKEIGKKLGISVSTVEKHVALGLKMCREHMLARLNDGSIDEKVEYLFDMQEYKSPKGRRSN